MKLLQKIQGGGRLTMLLFVWSESDRRLIHAIRDSASTQVGGRTALDKEFDRSIEEELEGIDDPLFDPRTRSSKGGKKSRVRPSIPLSFSSSSQY